MKPLEVNRTEHRFSILVCKASGEWLITIPAPNYYEGADYFVFAKQLIKVEEYVNIFVRQHIFDKDITGRVLDRRTHDHKIK